VVAFEILSPSDQVQQHLRDLILKGVWRGDLPGTPALSSELGVDRKTIMAALKGLEEAGLVEAQGPGKPRRILLTKGQKASSLRIEILLYEERNRTELLYQKIQSRLQEAGHSVSFSTNTLTGMRMELSRVRRYIEAHPADIWIPLAASQGILEWFSRQDFATLALFGRRRRVNLASVGPGKIEAMEKLTERLIELGHHRIVLLCREERRHPEPGLNERRFLETLDSHGIPAGSYNLPEWTSNAEGLKECLDRLFGVTPPTALIVEEPLFYVAVVQHLATRGLSAPQDISIVCTDDDLVFQACIPPVTCLRWEHDPVIQHVARWVREASRGRIRRECIETPTEIFEGGTMGPVRQDLELNR
jgi:DNA-binding LacI/PurR family transcriptional regulator